MIVQSAEIENTGDHLALRLVTDEGTAYIETPKQRLLAVAAIVSGPDVTAGRFPTITVNLPADPSDGRIDAQEFKEACQDPVVLEMARRWSVGEYGDGVGPVAVVPFEEADAGRWRFEAGRLVRK